MRTSIVNGRIVNPSGVKLGSLIIENGKIVSIVPGKVKADEVIDANGAYVLPGFFDSHVHGGGGFDSSAGRFNPSKNKFDNREELYSLGIASILREHAKHGTTSMIMSTGTNTESNILKFMKAGSCYVGNNSGGSNLLGMDIEGVFIKEAAYAGAQDITLCKAPDIKLFDKYMKASGGNIKRVLVAPEYGASALKLIKYLVKQGVVPGVGHSGASYAEFMRAFEAGVKVLIHFGNGPLSQNFKSGGIVDAAFELRDKIYAEVICDYHHVNPKWIVSFLKNFNFKVIGITDAMFVIGCGNGVKEFMFGNTACTVDKEVLRVKDSKAGALAGSKLTMDVAFKNFLNMYMKNLSGYLVGPLFDRKPGLDEAVVSISSLMSTNPAKLYGFDKEMGTLAQGKNADIVVMDIKKTGKEYSCKVNKVFVNGKIAISN